MSDPVPVVLYGEGNYALTDIKEIKVTEEFLGLGEKKTGCGREEVKGECESRRYRDQLLASCGCVPFSLASHYQQKVESVSRRRTEVIIL